MGGPLVRRAYSPPGTTSDDEAADVCVGPANLGFRWDESWNVHDVTESVKRA